MIALLDTSIVVDLLREYQPAEQWLQSQGILGVTRAVWIEVLEGAQNRLKQQRAVKLLKSFELAELTVDDMIWATHTLIKYNLAAGVDGYDCMIASVSHRLQIPLYTHNLKHFRPLLVH